MARKNFKIGDIVTCAKGDRYAITTKGIKCKVISVSTSNKYHDMTVEIIEEHNPYRGNRYGVCSKDFKKVPTAVSFTSKVNGIYCKCIPIEDNEELVEQWTLDILDTLSHYDFQIFVMERNTVVIISDDKWNTVKVGTARCADTDIDKYDVDIGKAVAAAKALNIEIPNFIYE